MTDMERILQAIESQRWFFFENNKKIIMDSRTGIIWANLDYFPYQKPNGNGYSYSEVEKLMAESYSFGNLSFGHWTLPTSAELWNMIEDRTFPFQEGTNWQIKNHRFWCIDVDGSNYGNLKTRNLVIHESSNDKLMSDDRNFVILKYNFFGNSYRNTDYPAIPKEILYIFKDSKLIPIFNDNEINELCKKMLTEPQQDKKSVSSFDCQSIIERFDMAAVDKSAIRYYEAVLRVADELLATLPENDTSEAMAEKKRKLIFVKDQAETFFKRLDEINTGYDSICELAKLEAMPRPSFAFLVESLTRIIKEQ